MKYLEILFRVVTILPMFLAITLLTGRRKVGELPVFDFLSLLAVGAVVGADIADPEIEHLPTAYAIVLIMLLHYIYSLVLIKIRWAGKLLTFEPLVVIENGQFVKGNMKKLKYSIDNILTFLREKDIFDLNEVEFAIIESTGNLSVLKKSQYLPVTPIELEIDTDNVGLSIPLIVEGKIYMKNLDHLNLNKTWLDNQLKNNHITSEKDVFYAAVNTNGNLYISKGLEKSNEVNDLRH